MEHAKIITNSGICVYHLLNPTSSLVKKTWRSNKVTFQISQPFLLMSITRQLNKENKQERMIKMIEFEIKTKSKKNEKQFKK